MKAKKKKYYRINVVGYFYDMYPIDDPLDTVLGRVVCVKEIASTIQDSEITHIMFDESERMDRKEQLLNLCKSGDVDVIITNTLTPFTAITVGHTIQCVRHYWKDAGAYEIRLVKKDKTIYDREKPIHIYTKEIRDHCTEFIVEEPKGNKKK